MAPRPPKGPPATLGTIDFGRRGGGRGRGKPLPLGDKGLKDCFDTLNAQLHEPKGSWAGGLFKNV